MSYGGSAPTVRSRAAGTSEPTRRSLRVLWLSHFVPYPPTGGNLQRSYHLVREAAQRHEVHVVALNQRAVLPSPERVHAAIEQLSRFCSGVDVFPNRWDRSSIHRFGLAAWSFVHPAPYDENSLRSRAMAAHLASIARTGRFDLVHVDTVGLAPYTALVPGVPVVLNHHNVESQLVRRRAEREPHLVRRLYFHREAGKLQRLERRACPRAAVNLTVSELDATRLVEVAPAARTSVIENGVDIEYFSPGRRTETDRGGLVFAGTLSWYPNHEAIRYFLSHIWPALSTDDPRRRVTFVGRDPPSDLLAAARDGRIRVTGRVDDVRPYFEEASIYICPIRDGGGTRLKILDALAMAKPLVATELAVEGLPLIDGEHYLRAETPEQFVAQIRRLETDASLRRTMGQRGRAFVAARYSWQVIGQKLDSVYQRAAAPAAPVS